MWIQHNSSSLKRLLDNFDTNGVPSSLHLLDDEWVAWCMHIPSQCERLLSRCHSLIIQFLITLLEWLIPQDVSWLKLLCEASRDDAELTVSMIFDGRLDTVPNVAFECIPHENSLVKAEQVPNTHHPVFRELFVQPSVLTVCNDDS